MSSILLNEKEIARAISRISHEILERNKGAENIALIGIRTRGVAVSTRLKQKINDIENLDVAVGALDITLYRVVKYLFLGVSMNIHLNHPDDFIQLDLNHNSARLS